MFRVDANTFSELRAMVRGLKFLERDWLSAWTKEGRAELEPQWERELEASRPSRLQRAVLVRTSRVSFSRRAITLKAGTVGRLSSGAKPAALARGAEFGQRQDLKSKYLRRDKPVPAPAQHTVTRRTAHPIGPRNAKGNVVWPALARFVPKATAKAAELFYDLMRRLPGFD